MRRGRHNPRKDGADAAGCSARLEHPTSSASIDPGSIADRKRTRRAAKAGISRAHNEAQTPRIDRRTKLARCGSSRERASPSGADAWAHMQTAARWGGRCCIDHRVEGRSVLGRPGSDLLFQALRLSTIGAGEFNGRVRDGIGYRLPAITTRPAKDGRRKPVFSHQTITDQVSDDKLVNQSAPRRQSAVR